ncbi:MAG: tRNA pseudouridine(38-40) synthase TruA [Janthinobacterium lividum]
MFPHPSQAASTDQCARTFRLIVAYDGADFFGWQVQPRLATVQGALADAVRAVTGENVLPQGSGRTDTGVHAEGQTVSLTLRSAIPAERLHSALNRRLPSAIRVVSVHDAPEGFHARADVLHKIYEYRIFERGEVDPIGRVCPPHVARYAWDCRWAVCLDRMQEAALQVIGTHDFTSFAAADPDRSRRLDAADTPLDNVRTIYQSTWERREQLLRYRVCGSGFLHHMVRNLVGTCVEIGAGRMHAGSIPSILEARNRRRAGPTAPPQGLHLMRVAYKQDGGEMPPTMSNTGDV